MEYKKYNIHNLIEIQISLNLFPEVIEEIEFQIGSFSSLYPDRPNSIVPVIWIKPVNEFNRNKNESHFYNFKGRENSYISNEDESLFVEFRNGDIFIYSNLANYLINIFIQLLLVNTGRTLCHGSAFINPVNKEVILFTGPGGVGKTAILSYVVGELGYQHFGDDIVVLSNEGECLSFPRKFVIKSYHQEQMKDVFIKFNLSTRNNFRFKKILLENLPFIGLLKTLLKNSRYYHKISKLIRPISFISTLSSDDLFGSNFIAKKGVISKVIFLERLNVDVFSLSKVEDAKMSSRMSSIIHYEFKEFYNTFISMAAMSLFDFNAYMRNVGNIFDGVVNKTESYHLEIPVNSSPSDLIGALVNFKILSNGK